MDDSKESEDDDYRYMYVVEDDQGYFGVVCETYEDAYTLVCQLGLGCHSEDPDDAIKKLPVVTFQREVAE